MKKFVLYVMGYSCLFAALVGVIHLDRTTTFFDKTRNLVGIETSGRLALDATPTIMSVARAYFSGEVTTEEAKDVMFGARRWPDYRPVLPAALPGWQRDMPFRIDDSEIMKQEAALLGGLFSFDGVLDGVTGMDPQQMAELKAAFEQVKQAVETAGVTQNTFGLGGLAYKSSGAYYSRDNHKFLISINKTWQSSFGAINDMAVSFAEMFSGLGHFVDINGREFRVSKLGEFYRLSHMVGTKARVYVIGRAPLPEILRHLEQLDLEPVYALHQQGGASFAARKQSLPQVR